MSFRIYPSVFYDVPYITIYANGKNILDPEGWKVITNNAININFRKSSYGQGKWIVVASSGITSPSTGEFITSTDGIKWTPGFGGPAFYDGSSYNQYVDILFANNIWVAVSRQGSLTRAISSPDGINWTKRDTSGGATTALSATSFNAIQYDQNQFVIVGGNSNNSSITKIFTSPDGITWTGRRIVLQSDMTTIDSTASVNEWIGVAYGNNVWVAVASTSPSSLKKVIISTDGGLKWYSPSTLSTVMNTRTWQRVAFGNGLFVAVSSNVVSNCIATSSDGINWTLRNAPSSEGTFYSIAFGNGIFIAVSQNGFHNRTITSSDGINWKTLYSPVDNNFYGITFANNTWLANSNSGTNNRIMKLDYVDKYRIKSTNYKY